MIDNLSTMKTAILSILQSVQNLTVVYGYEKGELPSYPAATIYSAEYNPEWADTTSDRDTVIFTIHLYQEIDNQTPEKSETIVDNMLTKIVQGLQANYTLSGACDIMRVRAVKGWINREVTNRAATITVALTKLNRII